MCASRISLAYTWDTGLILESLAEIVREFGIVEFHDLRDETMLTTQTICLLAPLAMVLLSAKCLAHPSIRQHQEIRPLCEGCGNECHKCEYGVIISMLCGVPECKRGPGQICGGPSETWGVCGDGMICSCNRCSGCSVDTLLCSPNSCLPHQSLESRHLASTMFERYPAIPQ